MTRGHGKTYSLQRVKYKNYEDSGAHQINGPVISIIPKYSLEYIG